jgi:hypothetical protein
MKLEFLDDISEGGKYPQVVSEQLIRLYDFSPDEALLFKEIIQNDIAIGKGEIELSALDFVDGINCKLTLKISNADFGITTNDKYNFVCSLTIEGYERMLHLIEPFCCRDSDGYQWLYDHDCAIDFLFSPGGTW